MSKIIKIGKILKRISLKQGDEVYLIDGSCAKTIADMQRDIDAYHTAFANIIGYLKGRFDDRRKPTILAGLAASEYINNDISMITEAAMQLREKYEKQLKETQQDNGVE